MVEPAKGEPGYFIADVNRAVAEEIHGGHIPGCLLGVGDGGPGNSETREDEDPQRPGQAH